ncbi:MAG: hypothetical protein ACKOAH_03445, partial [Pirellula sp.]
MSSKTASHRSIKKILWVTLSLLVFIPTTRSSAQEAEAFRPDQTSTPVAAPPDAIVLLDANDHQFLSMRGEAIDWKR